MFGSLSFTQFPLIPFVFRLRSLLIATWQRQEENRCINEENGYVHDRNAGRKIAPKYVRCWNVLNVHNDHPKAHPKAVKGEPNPGMLPRELSNNDDDDDHGFRIIDMSLMWPKIMSSCLQEQTTQVHLLTPLTPLYWMSSRDLNWWWVFILKVLD